MPSMLCHTCCRDLSWIAASGSGAVAAVSSAGDVVVHDAVTGKQKWKSKVSGQPLTYCAFSEATDRLVVASTYLFVFNANQVAVKLSGHAVCLPLLHISASQSLLNCQLEL